VVTAGRLGELAFTLSRSSAIPAGVIGFRVTNRGAGTRAYEICTNATRGADYTVINSCAHGVTTPLLPPGASAMISARTTRPGEYE
jgi:hypothetical protein